MSEKVEKGSIEPFTADEKVQLLKKYDDLFKYFANRTHLNGYEFDDLYQEYRTLFWGMLSKYDAESGALTTLFFEYAKRWLREELEKTGTKKRAEANRLLSLNMVLLAQENKTIELVDIIRDNAKDIQELMAMEEFHMSIINYINSRWKDKKKLLLPLVLGVSSIRAVAKRNNVSHQYVSQIWAKFKNEVQEYFKEEGEYVGRFIT